MSTCPPPIHRAPPHSEVCGHGAPSPAKITLQTFMFIKKGAFYKCSVIFLNFCNHAEPLKDSAFIIGKQLQVPIFFLSRLRLFYKTIRTHPRTSLFLTQAYLSHNIWVTRNPIILGPQMTDSRSWGFMVKGTNKQSNPHLMS